MFRRLRDRKGMTTVEFALVGPAFFLVVFASIEFCRLSMIRNLTQDAAYFAARSAMVPGATASEAIAEANRILGYLNTKEATVSINGDDSGNGGLDDDTDEIAVTISVPVAANSLLVPKFTGDITFEATAVLRTERYDGYYDPFAIN